MSISCLIACCTLIKATSSVPTNPAQHTTAMEQHKCLMLKEHMECLTRLGIDGISKEQLLYAVYCGKGKNK